MRAERATEHLLGLRRGGDQLRQVDPGCHAHLLQHRHQILGGDVAGRPGWDRATPELAEGALERVDALLERRQHVRKALSTSVVEVRGELGIRETHSGGREELAHLARVGHPGRVPEGDLLAAEAHEPLGDLEDALGRNLALVWAAEAGRDHALAAQPHIPGGGDRALQVGQRLVDRAIDVLAVVGLGGREEEVRFLEAVAELECVLEALPVRDQHRIRDVLPRLEPRQAPRRRRRAGERRPGERTR